MNKKILYVIGATALILLSITKPTLSAQKYEATVVLDALSLLPADLLRGPNHQIESVVYNDGFLNIYTIQSKYGELQAVSTAKLTKYIDEINAAARMEVVKGSDEFKHGIKEKAGDVIEGAAALVSDPVDTVSNTVSGLGKLFSRANENLFGGSRSDVEGSRVQDLTGYSKTKRDYAYEFNVDVYSRNFVMQTQLDELTRAGHGGTLAMSALLVAVPGAAGTAVSISGGTKLMDSVFRDSAPADLRKMNREKLAKMGVSKDVSDLFIANSVYTPREQTLLVAALDAMPNTQARDNFIKFAVLTENEDIAFFRQRQALMYSAFNQKVKPIDSFVSIGRVSAGLTKDKTLIFIAPVDHIIWSKEIASHTSRITENVSRLDGVMAKELYVSGTLSPLARDNISKMGWTVHEDANQYLNNK